LSEVGHRIARRTHAAVERADERLSMRVDRLGRSGPAVLERATEQLDRVALRVVERPAGVLDRAGQRLDVLAARVGGLDPAVQIARGWTITRDAAGAIVRSVADIGPDDIVTTTLIDGTVTSTVTASVPTVDDTITTNEDSS
jgi:exodeoxyribonuclease VII large subunit